MKAETQVAGKAGSNLPSDLPNTVRTHRIGIREAAGRGNRERLKANG